MHHLYRILGIAANLTERSSRTSGNGVPSNWLVLILLGFFVAITIHEAVEVKVNEGDPIKTTIGEAIYSDRFLDRYLTFNGQLHPEEGLVETADGKPKNNKIFWIPLVDAERRNSILVKTDTSQPNRGVISRIEGSQSSFAAAPKVSVSGMLRKVPTDLQTSIRISSNPIGGVRPNNEYMLEAGTKPSGFVLWVALAGAIALPMLLMLIVIFKRYIIFRPRAVLRGGIDLSAIPAAPDQENPPELYVTARFMLNDKLRKLFHRVRAVLAHQENGDIALLANVDASIRLFGAVTSNRAGIWAVVMRNESLSEPEYGTLYFGLKTYPAFRIRYTDAIKRKPAIAILASNTSAGLERIRKALHELPPLFVPAAIPATPAAGAPEPQML